MATSSWWARKLHCPYDKPPLSKALLAGTSDIAAVTLLSRDAAAADRIELLLGRRAIGVDVAACQVEFADDEPLRYDHLVVATGASARPSPWGQGSGIHVLRTLEDCLRLRDDLVAGVRLVVIGEDSSGPKLRQPPGQWGQVTVVDPVPVPMSRVLTEEIGEWFIDLHRNHGVHTCFGIGVENVEGSAATLRSASRTGPFWKPTRWWWASAPFE